MHFGKTDPVTIIEIILTGNRVGLQSGDDLVLAPGEVLFAGLFLVQNDLHLMVPDIPIALNACRAEAGFLQRGANFIIVGSLSEFHIDPGAATELHAQRNAVPETHRENASHAENQREREEIPLPAKKIYVGITKKFHFNLTFALDAQSFAPPFAAEDSIENYA